MKRNFLIVLMPVFLLLSCGSRAKISDGYYIKTNEDGPTVYYVVNNDSEGGGVFDGTVSELGWKGKVIMAKIRRLASIDPSGYYKLNLETGIITGPIEDTQEISLFTLVDASAFYENPKAYKKD